MSGILVPRPFIMCGGAVNEAAGRDGPCEGVAFEAALSAEVQTPTSEPSASLGPQEQRAVRREVGLPLGHRNQVKMQPACAKYLIERSIGGLKCL